MLVTVAEDAEMVVTTAIFDAKAIEAPPLAPAPKVEPQLNPYHPIHKMLTPSAQSSSLGLFLPSPDSKDLRGPRATAPISPAKPPTVCTTAEPA
mmetsp:Transcript_35539/g.68620  ORF Transcript_35539/g.68620 Transcript_35539/m.68620 type:complete len:94 (-) Transcript_35539:703-984(-)